MRLPQERISIRKDFEGHRSPDGFIIVNLKGLDIEGVTTLVIDGAHLREAQAQGQQRRNAAQRLRNLLKDNE